MLSGQILFRQSMQFFEIKIENKNWMCVRFIYVECSRPIHLIILSVTKNIKTVKIRGH